MYTAIFEMWLDEKTEWVRSADAKIIEAGGGFSAADQRVLADVESSPDNLALRERLRDALDAPWMPTAEALSSLVDEVHGLLLMPDRAVSAELEDELTGLISALNLRY